jgi:hypothetical protein
VTLAIYTATVAYRGDDRLDISRAGNHPLGVLLAPSWPLLTGALAARRAGKLTRERWLAYIEAYTGEVTPNLPRVLEQLRDGASVTLCCHCREGQCHRTAAANLLVAAAGGAAVYEGERA